MFTQGSAARDKLIEQLLEQVEIPVPPQLIEDEVHTHLEGEGRLEDDVHRAEVTEASEKQFKTQMLLDAIAEKVNVSVSQDELTQYLVQSAAQYGMAPQEFVNALQENNQLPAIVGEVARNKALAVALGKVTVVDTNGNPVDLTGFVAVEDEAAAEDEVVEEAEEIADAAAEADEIIEAEEAAAEARPRRLRPSALLPRRPPPTRSSHPAGTTRGRMLRHPSPSSSRRNSDRRLGRADRRGMGG